MAKYDSNSKRARDEQLCRYARENPTLSQAEIGKVFNISPQRVSQIIKKSR